MVNVFVNIDFEMSLELNTDASLARQFFRIGQMHQRLAEWETIPNFLSARLDEIFSFVQPPKPDLQITKELFVVRQQFEENMKITMKKHIERNLKEAEQCASVSTEGRAQAEETATKWLEKRFGQDAKQPWRSLAATRVGTVETETRNNEKSVTELGIGNTIDNAPESTVCDTVRCVSLQQKRAGRKHIYSTKKYGKLDWQCKIDSEAELIILADSNFRRARYIPDNCEIHVFPGANMVDMVNIIQLSPNLQNKHVVASVGINNRSCTSDAMAIGAGKLADALYATTSEAFVTAIPTTSRLPVADREGVNKVNVILRNIFRKKFINIKTCVTAAAYDRSGVHYDQKSMDMIMNEISACLKK